MAIAIRPATMDDFAFVDSLQGKYNKQIGWMPRRQLEGKIRAGHVLVAESALDEPRASASGSGSGSDRSLTVALDEPRASASGSDSGSGPLPHGRSSLPEGGTPVGFVIGTDQYFKRDDCGIIYQLCVVEGQRRGLIGAALVKAMFERSAWGCKLFACWCAQDLEANHFWESLGFVPLAFRAGSRRKARVHIFWQKRVREGDAQTPFWFPSETKGGSLREDRLVLPIPPGTHWSEAKRVLLPGTEAEAAAPRPAKRKAPAFIDPIAHLSAKERRKLPVNIVGGLRCMVPAPAPEPEKKPAVKNDPRYIAFARELRDRWLEAIATDPSALLPRGKYDLARALPAPEPLPHGRGSLPEIVDVKALPQAA